MTARGERPPRKTRCRLSRGEGGERTDRWGRVFGRVSHVAGMAGRLFVPCERRKRRLTYGGLMADEIETSNADRTIDGQGERRLCRVSENCPVRACFIGGMACARTRVKPFFVMDVLHLPQSPNRPRRRKIRQAHASAEAVQNGMRRTKTTDSRRLNIDDRCSSNNSNSSNNSSGGKRDTFEGRA